MFDKELIAPAKLGKVGYYYVVSICLNDIILPYTITGNMNNVIQLEFMRLKSMEK